MKYSTAKRLMQIAMPAIEKQGVSRIHELCENKSTPIFDTANKLNEAASKKKGFESITTAYSVNEHWMLERALQSLASDKRAFALIYTTRGYEIAIPKGERLVAPRH